ncbi:hypothetical protein BN946_scf185013.g113 [Trametes cinnabarina]|uniref:Arrestin C-terminal-like domain-containing protein n=1 Tax=Pycnoporus cinnabarinus TaxID=5643 RepID=A0A060SM36_PYCCI|nr:hypothetical protein BN946_scf185013.g113 [Trametes cinnabarina]
MPSAARSATSESSFSRHDSLFSFGVPSSRNAAELKSFLGNSNSRLKPGAAVLPLQKDLTKCDKGSSAVSLEQAKARARVEVDIVLENDCCVEGGYLRGFIKVRVRRRHKKEDPVLLADGKIRVIGFESIPGASDRHTFYQRASSLRTVTDKYAGIFDSQPDPEGFSHALEGVHVLPFAMHLPADSEFGAPKGMPYLQAGVTIRYIAMISVKVKDSKTGKRSIAHFYRDCQIWPRLELATVLARAPRPIQASTARSLSVMGGGNKVKLTAVLPRIAWLAGQRCYVHLSVANDTKKTVKGLTLTLVKTTTLFRPKPALDYGHRSSADPDACQTTTTHKVVAESILEKSQGVAKGHASAQGWWTGVSGGQDAEFSHYVLIPSDALSVARARLIEVEYSIRVSLRAGPLASDVQVTLPLRVVNFMSLDPLCIPSAPLLSTDGSYARLVPRATSDEEGSAGTKEDKETSAGSGTESATVSVTADREMTQQSPGFLEGRNRRSSSAILQVVNPDSPPPDAAAHAPPPRPPCASDSENSLYSTDSSASAFSCYGRSNAAPVGLNLGNLELSDAAGSDDEVDFVLRSAHPEVPAAVGPQPSGRSHIPSEKVAGWQSSVRSAYRDTHGRMSDASIVRGRIAVFEERVKTSEENGAAYV